MKIYGLSVLAGIFAGCSLFVWYGWQWVFAYFLSVNVVTLVAYGFDKGISHMNTLRIPEKLLHVLAIAGGSPAALFGQRFFRHKTKKSAFQILYWITVLIQMGIIVWIFRS